MLHTLFIGKLNQTNSIICDLLESQFDAEVDFIDPKQIFSPDPPSVINEKDIIIIDLNSSSGFGHATDNVREISSYAIEKSILVLHNYESFKFIQPLIEAGALGVISNTPTEDELSQAINNLLGGKSFVINPEK